MSELISIPLESDRRATAVLAAVRRLQAEYQAGPEASWAPTDGAGDGAPAAGRRGPRRGVRSERLAALVGGAVGATVALVLTAHAPGLRAPGGLTAGLLAGVYGALAGALAGLLASRAGEALRGHRPRGGIRAPTDAPATPDEAGGPTVTWLVSYVMRDGDSTGPARLRASVLQVTLPAEAEGRLKAILARADAATSR